MLSPGQSPAVFEISRHRVKALYGRCWQFFKHLPRSVSGSPDRLRHQVISRGNVAEIGCSGSFPPSGVLSSPQIMPAGDALLVVAVPIGDVSECINVSLLARRGGAESPPRSVVVLSKILKLSAMGRIRPKI